MPVYKVERELFKKSLVSILRQSYLGHYEVLVIFDGEEMDLPYDHPRLRTFTLEENHGRYFADCVALEASPFQFYLNVDADDINQFDRITHLMRTQQKTNADFVYNYQKVFMKSGKMFRETYPLMSQPLSDRMRHICHWSGLYKTDSLRGLINPDWRVGQDTLITNLIKLNYKTAGVPRFLYTRYAREGSLTSSPETGFGSPYRHEITYKLIDLYRKCMKHPERSREYVKKETDPKTLREVSKEAARLKEAMGW